MERIAWIADSTCYMEPEWVERYGIHIVPLSVVFGGESYKEGVEIDNPTFYEELKRRKEPPTTSQPAIGDFVALYERLKENYDKGIAVHLSSGISGTFDTSRTAAEMAGFPVAVIDSEIACTPMSWMLMEGIELQRKGASFGEIVAYLQAFPKRVRAYFLVADLAHLHRGGRLNAAQYLVGSMLQIKPILHIQEKRIVPFEKVRTYKKAKGRMLELFRQDVEEKGLPLKVALVHANVPEEAEEWKREMEGDYPGIKVHISEFGPVIATHVGPGTMGLTWYR